MLSKRLVASMLTGILALSVVGCGQQEETPTQEKTEEKVEKVEEEPTDDRQVVGEESKDAFEVALTNGLGGSIESLYVRVTGEDSYSDNVLEKNAKIAANEEVRLFVKKAEAKNATYDLRVKLEGAEDEIEFLEVPLADCASAKLAQDDGVAFVEYVDKKGAKDSTKEAALERKAAEDEAKAADETALEQTESSQGYSGSSQYYDESAPVEQAPAATQSEPAPAPEPVAAAEPAPEPVAAPEPAPAETSDAPAQSEDACVGDVVLRY